MTELSLAEISVPPLAVVGVFTTEASVAPVILFTDTEPATEIALCGPPGPVGASFATAPPAPAAREKRLPVRLALTVSALPLAAFSVSVESWTNANVFASSLLRLNAPARPMALFPPVTDANANPPVADVMRVAFSASTVRWFAVMVAFTAAARTSSVIKLNPTAAAMPTPVVAFFAGG